MSLLHMIFLFKTKVTAEITGIVRTKQKNSISNGLILTIIINFNPNHLILPHATLLTSTDMPTCYIEKKYMIVIHSIPY